MLNILNMGFEVILSLDTGKEKLLFTSAMIQPAECMSGNLAVIYVGAMFLKEP